MVLSVAVLFAAFGSIVVELTVARLVIVPQMAGVTVMVIGGAPPGATIPRVQVTTPPACTQVQPVPEALWKVTPAGRLSVTCTLAAVDAGAAGRRGGQGGGRGGRPDGREAVGGRGGRPAGAREGGGVSGRRTRRRRRRGARGHGGGGLADHARLVRGIARGREAVVV